MDINKVTLLGIWNRRWFPIIEVSSLEYVTSKTELKGVIKIQRIIGS